jgi:hypothetical protein
MNESVGIHDEYEISRGRRNGLVLIGAESTAYHLRDDSHIWESLADTGDRFVLGRIVEDDYLRGSEGVVVPFDGLKAPLKPMPMIVIHDRDRERTY